MCFFFIIVFFSVCIIISFSFLSTISHILTFIDWLENYFAFEKKLATTVQFPLSRNNRQGFRIQIARIHVSIFLAIESIPRRRHDFLQPRRS